MKKLRIALDWTANNNHTGFYVAQRQGFYKQVGIDLEIVTPDQDNSAVTPAKKVELGTADFALCPLESIISYKTKNTPFDAVALAAIFQEDISAIATFKNAVVESQQFSSQYYRGSYSWGVIKEEHVERF